MTLIHWSCLSQYINVHVGDINVYLQQTFIREVEVVSFHISNHKRIINTQICSISKLFQIQFTYLYIRICNRTERSNLIIEPVAENASVPILDVL